MLRPGKRVADIFSKMKDSRRGVSIFASVREQCHPERYSAKDLASQVEARSFASTLRMTSRDRNLIGQLHRIALHHRLRAALDRVRIARALGDVRVALD